MGFPAATATLAQLLSLSAGSAVVSSSDLLVLVTSTVLFPLATLIAISVVWVPIAASVWLVALLRSSPTVCLGIVSYRLSDLVAFGEEGIVSFCV